MMDKLYEVKERLMDEIEEYADKGKLSANDAMTLKALTGSVDHLCNIIDGAENYSGDYRGTYRGEYSRKRDSMGRYSRTYSRHSLTDKLRELMGEAPDERTRMEIQRLVDKMA